MFCKKEAGSKLLYYKYCNIFFYLLYGLNKVYCGWTHKMASINVVHIAVIIFMAFNLQFPVVQNAVITRNEGIQSSYNAICLTADCIKQAAFFLNNMDQTVDPCDDFYKHTCGNFIKKALIPQDKLGIGSISLIQDRLTNDLLDGIQKEIKLDDLDAFKKMKIHYQNCLNETRIEEEGVKPYLDILQKIGGWPVLMGSDWNEETYAWEDTLVKLEHLGFTIGFPFYLIVGSSSKNETSNIFHLYSAMTMIYNETELYLENNKSLNAYYDFILDIALMLGANNVTAYQEVKDSLDFEIQLLKIETPFQQIKKNSSNQQITILELSEKFQNVNWLQLLNNILSLENETINETDVIEVFDMNYVNKLGILISTTPKRVIANYQIWNMLYRIIGFMPKKFVTRRTIYHSIAYEGMFVNSNREIECLNTLKGSFSIAVNALYVRKYFDHEVKERVKQMASDIKNQFIENFKKGWQSHENTTEEILNQIKSMNMSVAYPEELLDDKKLEEYYNNIYIDPGLYFDSALNISLFRTRKMCKNFKKPIDKNNWIRNAYVAFVNAFYRSENVVGLPAGILHEPFVYINGPEYLNYGGIGSVIAHEITHGLYKGGQKNIGNDTVSRNNDTDAKNFDQCVIDKYNNYTISEGIVVNGSLTLHENVPDITGLKIAYQAYNEWIKRNNVIELNLPGLDYTPLQMFWISAASANCRKYKTTYLKKLMQWDTHSPAEARVNVAFSNIDDFAKDFKCEEGLKMNPEKKCDLW